MDTVFNPRTIGFLVLATVLGYQFHSLIHPEKRRSNEPDPAISTASSFASLDKILQEPRTTERDQKLRLLIERIADRDIPAAMVRLKGVRDDWVIHNLQLELLTRWAQIDPRAAVAWQPTGRTTRYVAILLSASTWAEEDAEAAAAWLESLPGGEQRQAAQIGVLGAIAARDPGKAIALLLSRPKLAADDGWGTIFAKIAASDPQLAFAEALKIPEGSNRTEALKSIAVIMAGNDPKGAENWIRQLPPGNARKEAMQQLIRMLIYEDPKEAIRVSLSEKAAGRDQKSDLFQAIDQWQRRDNKSARAWVDSLPAGGQRAAATQALVMSWSEKEPEAAVNYALESPDGPTKATTTGVVLGQWLAEDFQSALSWINSHSEVIQPTMLFLAARNLTWTKPASAVIILEKLPDGTQRSQSYQGVAEGWARSHPEAAEAWMDKMPEGAGKEAFTKGFIRTTASTDLPTALKAFETLPSGVIRNETAEAIVSSWAKADPRAALDWVERPNSPGHLQGPPLERATRKAISLWLKQDKDAAKAWLQSSSLSEAQKQSLLNN